MPAEKGSTLVPVDEAIKGFMYCGLLENPEDIGWVAHSLAYLTKAGSINRADLIRGLIPTLELDLLMGGEPLYFRFNKNVTEMAFNIVPGQATCQYQVSARLTGIRFDPNSQTLILKFGEVGEERFDYCITRNVGQASSSLEVKQPFNVVPTVVR